MGCGSSKDVGGQKSKKGDQRRGDRDGGSSPVVRTESGDKGYKRRVREKLRDATAGKDIGDLEKAIELFQRSRLQDCGDLTDALDRLRYLKLRRDLRDAVRRRHIGVLDKTIEEARSSPYEDRLAVQIESAERMRAHLQELNSYKHDILQMEQSTISEVHSYQRPPACVHDVMAATYMLLGYHESRLTDWADIQAMMGRVGQEKLLKQVAQFDTAAVDTQTVTRVSEILEYHNLDEVRQASNGAARFYVWSSNMVEMCQKNAREEEERKRQEALQQQQSARKKKG